MPDDLKLGGVIEAPGSALLQTVQTQVPCLAVMKEGLLKHCPKKCPNKKCTSQCAMVPNLSQTCARHPWMLAEICVLERLRHILKPLTMCPSCALSCAESWGAWMASPMGGAESPSRIPSRRNASLRGLYGSSGCSSRTTGLSNIAITCYNNLKI